MVTFLLLKITVRSALSMPQAELLLESLSFPYKFGPKSSEI